MFYGSSDFKSVICDLLLKTTISKTSKLFSSLIQLKKRDCINKVLFSKHMLLFYVHIILMINFVVLIHAFMDGFIDFQIKIFKKCI